MSLSLTRSQISTSANWYATSTLLPELLLRQLLGVVLQDAGAGIQWPSTGKALLEEDEGALPFTAQ